MANIGIAEKDLQLVEELKQSQIIKAINLDKLVLENWTMFMCCPDSKHFMDKIRHLEDLLVSKNCPNETFPITRGGGAIRALWLEAIIADWH